jgi:CHAT domain-containing protein/Tfp pilus assembly protein PilF
MMRWQTAFLVAVAVLLEVAVPRACAQEREEGLDALYRRAEALSKAGKVREAARVYQKVVHRARKELGPTHLNTAVAMNNLAWLYCDLRQYARAEPLFKGSLAIAEAQLGKDHLDVATTLDGLARLYKSTGQYGQAEPLLNRSLAIRESRLGKDHLDVAQSLSELSSLCKDVGRYTQAEPLCRRSLAIREARLGKSHPDVALSLSDLANLLHDMGQYAKAESLFQRSLEIYEAKRGKSHPDVATALNNLAEIYRAMGRYAKAEPLHRRGLTIREARLGKDHPDVAQSLGNLAGLYKDMGQYAKAEPLYQRCLTILEARLDKSHPDVATALNNLAGLYHAAGQYTKAEPLLKRSLEISESRQGKDHPDVATALHNLARLYQDMGQHARAEPLYLRSEKIRTASLGEDHPSLANLLHNLGSLYAATDQVGEAARFFDRARRGARRHLASVLPALSDADKEAFFQGTRTRDLLDMALSLGFGHKANADLPGQSAGWLLNAKGIDQESLASSALLTRQSSDPALSKLSGQLLSVRRQLARLTLAMPRAGQEKQRLKEIDELNSQEQELSRQLRQAGYQADTASWSSLADVRRSLPDDAVLIDLARFFVFDFKAGPEKEWQEAHYAAWVTPKSAPVRLIDLGPADKIDAAVGRFRQLIKEANTHIQAEGEDKAEKALRVHLDTLAGLVLAPLFPHIGKSKTWLVSPDSNLWLVPFEALPLADGSYAVEKHQIRYLTSGRDLLPAPAPKVRVRGPLVLADPDFDLDPKAARAEARRLLGERGEEATGAPSGAPRLGKAARLPGTAAEARAIAPSLKAYTGIAPRVLTGRQALEGVFRKLRNPRVLVVSTHGFFLPDQQAPAKEKGKSKRARKWENPLLRCGLLLAGCNNAARMSGGDDGVLTGLEVLGADLRGTELVVLSACETGLGEVQSGEGVAGLRQAFQLAGAQAVVSSLWQVPDKASARLMALFFQNLSKGQGKAEALRAAKIQTIKERREDAAGAHPFFWAAFTLTGRP